MALPSQSEIRPVLLRVLAAADGRARSAQVYPLVTARFQLEPADLARLVADGRTSLWTNRIQFVRQSLVEEGLIDRSERGVWQLTEAGWEAARTLPPPPVDLAAEGTEQEVDSHESVSRVEGGIPATAMAVVIAELRAAATDSASPSRLERACGQAFGALGFDVEVIGGAGNTDVVVSAPLGMHQYTAVVDAKSTGRGRVPDAQVDWLSIKQHRDRLDADFACVVGPSFGGGHLIQRATDFGIVLLSIDELAELLDLHATSPFALTELRSLFESTPVARAVLPRLRAVARDRRRLQSLLVWVLALIDNFNRVQPDLVVAKPETLQALALASSDERLAGTTMGEVSRVLVLLEAAGVLTALPSGGFASATSVAGALQRIGSLVPGWAE
jgi:Mrr N-terminal domain/Restriction endonuclease